MPSTEFIPKAKLAAQKAIAIDDSLATAHAVLGWTLFWYERNWTESENQYKRALELDRNSAEGHLGYAHLLSNTGRHDEALVQAKRARELEPLSMIFHALEGQFLIHAGRADEGLVRLQKALELDPNFWIAHLFASSAYIEKGMFAEAADEARMAKDLSGGSSQSIAFGAYALAKSGKQAEARVMLEEVIKLSARRHVPPYHVALIHHGLGDRDETFASLEQAFAQRDLKLVFLKVEPKWNNLRGDSRFQDLMRRVGFQP